MDGPGEAATRDAHKTLVRRFVDEAINRGNQDVVAEVCADAAVGAWSDLRTPESIRDLVLLYREAVPDAHWTIEQQVAEGEMLVTCFTARGTQRGALLGLAPTRKPMAVPGVVISRLEGHKVAVTWAQADLLGLLHQLGVMPDLSLDRAMVVARVLHAGALLAHERSLAPADPPPPTARAGPAYEQRQKRALSSHEGGE